MARAIFSSTMPAPAEIVSARCFATVSPGLIAAAMPPWAQADEAPSPIGAAARTVTGRGASFSAQNRPARPPPTTTTSSIPVQLCGECTSSVIELPFKSTCRRVEKPAPCTYFPSMTRSNDQPSRNLAAAGCLASALLLAAGLPAAAAGCGGSVQTGHGDSPLALANRCGTTVQQLRLANPGIDMNKPLRGQIIKVPGNRPPSYVPDSVSRGAAPAPAPLTPFGQSPTRRQYQKSLSRQKKAGPGTYTVRRGDTLSGIARRSNVALPALVDANPGIDPRRLAVGQKIVVPSMD